MKVVIIVLSKLGLLILLLPTYTLSLMRFLVLYITFSSGGNLADAILKKRLIT